MLGSERVGQWLNTKLECAPIPVTRCEVLESAEAAHIVVKHGPPIDEIETYGDHRFAMSFGILGCHDLHGDGRSWLAIKNPACCAKTFPNFFELLEEVRQKSLAT